MEILTDERGRPVAHYREPTTCVEPIRAPVQPVTRPARTLR